VDNCRFPNCGAHLHALEPCAPAPCPAVTATGTKAGGRLFLWITQVLCQNYPQFYALLRSSSEIWTKLALSACLASANSSSIHSNWTVKGGTNACKETALRMCGVRVAAVPPPNTQPLYRSAGAHFQCWTCPQRVLQTPVLGSGYSSIALYI